jgi:hypothetical protein
VINLIEWEARRKTLSPSAPTAAPTRRRRLPLRHPPAGRGRDGVLRRLRAPELSSRRPSSTSRNTSSSAISRSESKRPDAPPWPTSRLTFRSSGLASVFRVRSWPRTWPAPSRRPACR